MEATFVVVGGGIAGVSCAETLAFLQPKENIIILSESKLIKTVTNIQALTKTLINFDVTEKNASVLNESHRNIQVVHGVLIEINTKSNYIKTAENTVIKYKYLCLCMGAQPKIIPQAENNPHVLGIRDTDSVEHFLNKLSHSKRVAVVGNGGIASELVFKIKNVELFWIIKDKHVSATFIDPGAAEFFKDSLYKPAPEKCEKSCVKRMRYGEHLGSKSGAALGPDWYKNLSIIGNAADTPVKIIYESEVAGIKILDSSHEYSLELLLTNDTKIQCDLVVSATGVIPRSNFKSDCLFDVSEDGGIKVNEYMQTSVDNVYAAGDICSPNWVLAKHWFPMKLWSQARHMGCAAANSMSSKIHNEEILQDFSFEMFAHSTKLYGFKVILLGLYNGQKLGSDYDILLRMTKGVEYVKFVMQNHRLQGAILIGDTDLEEMCENLILNQLDLSPYGDDILNPNIDIEDYFD